MRDTWIGSGIFAQEVEYGPFTCGDADCLTDNEGGHTATDDEGNYSVECEACGWVYFESNLIEQRKEQEQEDRNEQLQEDNYEG
jgi:hypothetical protein